MTINDWKHITEAGSMRLCGDANSKANVLYQMVSQLLVYIARIAISGRLQVICSSCTAVIFPGLQDLSLLGIGIASPHWFLVKHIFISLKTKLIKKQNT